MSNERIEKNLHGFLNMSDATKRRISEGIEQYRKGDAVLRFRDRSGKAVNVRNVHVDQKGHEFRFGANIFMLDEFECEEKNREYRRAFPQYFNLATLPFYWSDLEPERGHPRYAKDSPKVYRRPAPDLCLEYCEQMGIEPKAHCLNYESFTPKWLSGAETPAAKAALEHRFRELSEKYAHRIPSWEVTNETFNPDMPEQTRFFREGDYVEWSFEQADKYFPSNRLIINDYTVFDGMWYRFDRSQYFMQIERLLHAGGKLDSIGFQYHDFYDRVSEAEKKHAENRYDPERLLAVFDLYAALGKKLQITETTLSAHSGQEWDEEYQAELLRYFYTLCFSHTAMEAVIYWNLVDGYAAWAPIGDMTAGENRFFGGLLRHDMSEKPAARMLRELQHKVWHTECDAELRDGAAHFRGFYGDYKLTVTDTRGHEHTAVLKHSSASDGSYTVNLED